MCRCIKDDANHLIDIGNANLTVTIHVGDKDVHTLTRRNDATDDEIDVTHGDLAIAIHVTLKGSGQITLDKLERKRGTISLVYIGGREQTLL